MKKLDRIMNGIINVTGALVLILVLLDVVLKLGLDDFSTLIIGLLIGVGMFTFKIEGRRRNNGRLYVFRRTFRESINGKDDE